MEVYYAVLQVVDIVYKAAYAKDYGQKPEYGPATLLSIKNSAPITLQMKQGYKYAGIVPISINGHSVNGNNKFLQAQQCYAETSNKNPNDKLVIKSYVRPDCHGRIMCEHKEQ